MKEIEFRGKTIKYGKWVYGSLEWLPDKYRDEPFIVAKILTPTEYVQTTNFDIHYRRHRSRDFKRKWLSHNVFPDTVGQYIGLQDNLCRRIYDGDICEYTVLVCENGKQSNRKVTVTADTANFNTLHSLYCLSTTLNLNIIGNRYCDK